MVAIKEGLEHRKSIVRIRERIIVLLSSLVLFGVTYFGQGITRQRVDVLERGTSVRCEVTKTTSKRSNKTFYVTIAGKELDGGENFGQYEDLNVGDVVEVKYLPNIAYVVARGVTGYRNMLIFQYTMFGVSALLFMLSVVNPKRWNPKSVKTD